jgi:hypothetical protein
LTVYAPLFAFILAFPSRLSVGLFLRFVADNTVNQVQIVGQILKVNPATTSINFQLDDGTGMIDVRLYADSEDPNSFEVPDYFSFMVYSGICLSRVCAGSLLLLVISHISTSRLSLYLISSLLGEEGGRAAGGIVRARHWQHQSIWDQALIAGISSSPSRRFQRAHASLPGGTCSGYNISMFL